MSASHGNDRQPKTPTDTVIGAGLRLDGNITCSGVMCILGEVHGDIACDPDSAATVIIGASGSITGATRAPHIIVAGNVYGPLVSSESIEIQRGANVAGDILYHAIQIHPGGVIQGTLNPVNADEAQRTGHRPPTSTTGITPAEATSSNAPKTRPLVRIVAAIALFGLVAIVVLLNRSPAPSTPPTAEAGGNAAPATGPATLAASATPGTTVRQDGTGTTAAAEADASSNKPAPEPPQQALPAGTEKLVVVQGVNPGKPGGVFSVVGKEPSVLIRKKRDEASEGTRIEVPQGAAASIPFARDEIFRVVQGRDIEIFYQGRKVTPKTIESGAWMSFVPQSGETGVDK